MKEIQSTVVIVRIVRIGARDECVQLCWQQFYAVTAVLFTLALFLSACARARCEAAVPGAAGRRTGAALRCWCSAGSAMA
jgi:hypothetical protein